MTTETTYRFEAFEFEIGENRYGGFCNCGAYVQAGEGLYWSSVYCSQPGHIPGGVSHICSASAPREIAQMQKIQAALRERLANPPQLSAEEIARRQAAAARHAEEDAAWAARGLCRCKRCGGAGGSSMWPGWACYDCGGSGAVLSDD